MKTGTTRAVALVAPLVLLSGASRAEEKPTILERVQRKLAGNEDLRKSIAAPPEALESIKWMAGRWDAVVKTYGTGTDGEKVEKATRATRFELGGRWLVSRNRGAGPVGEEAVEILGFDPFQRGWRWQFYSSAGRGTNAALVSMQGWEGGRLTLSGSFFIYGESADVAMRLQKVSDDEYYEVFEEKLAEDVRRPFLEYHYTRSKAPRAARAAPKPAAK